MTCLPTIACMALSSNELIIFLKRTCSTDIVLKFMIQKRILGEVRQEKADTSEDIDLNDEDMLFLQCMH